VALTGIIRRQAMRVGDWPLALAVFGTVVSFSLTVG
jgi:hypothetical protein